MSDDDIERCLERLSTCKATDVMNFDYSGTLEYIKRLKAENADLHERLKEAEHRAEVAERQAILLSKWLAEKTRKGYPWQARFDEAQKQAEKEFAEEDKR